jgi:hypothetical protein
MRTGMDNLLAKIRQKVTATEYLGMQKATLKLTQEQLDRVERAIIDRWGFAWKSWQEEAQVIWNALAEERK